MRLNILKFPSLYHFGSRFHGKLKIALSNSKAKKIVFITSKGVHTIKSWKNKISKALSRNDVPVVTYKPAPAIRSKLFIRKTLITNLDVAKFVCKGVHVMFLLAVEKF